MKIGLRSALGIGLSVALLWWALRDVHFTEVWGVLRQSDPWLFAASTLAGTLIFPLRARRWRTILEPIAGRLPFGMLWRSTAIGMMVNNTVPARAGELARAFALTRETPRVTFSAGIASLAVDRAFDAIVVLLLMLLAMLDPRFAVGAGADSRAKVTAAAVAGAIGLGVVVAILYAIVFFPARLLSLYTLVARRVAPRFEARGRAILESFAEGLGVLRHPGRFVAVFLWTLAHWLLNAVAFWLGFLAVGIEAPFSAALLTQGIIAIGVALPSAPGFFGVFEVAARLGLELYGVPGNSALSWALGFHVLTFIPITLIGAVYFARLGLHMRDIGAAGGGPRAGSGAEPARAPASTGGGAAGR